MRVSLAVIPAVLALSVLAAGPAAARTGDEWRDVIHGDRAKAYQHVDRTSPASSRSARATINDAYEGRYEAEEARPRRSYRGERRMNKRYTGGTRQARGSKHTRARYGQRSSYGQRVSQGRGKVQRLPVHGHRVAARPVGSTQHGIASYYWQGQRLATGGWFNPDGISAAHRTLPFGTRVRVTHLRNGRSVDVRINDRGPYIAGRIIDLSRGAARIIGMTGQGIAQVRVTVLGR